MTFTVGSRIYRGVMMLFVLLAITLFFPSQEKAQWGEAEAIPRKIIFENERVKVSQITFPAGGHRDMHAAQQDVVFIMLTPGEVDMRINDTKALVHAVPGKTWWFPKAPGQHAIMNIGKEPFDVISVDLK